MHAGILTNTCINLDINIYKDNVELNMHARILTNTCINLHINIYKDKKYIH